MTCWSPGSADAPACESAEVAAARALVERDRRERVGAQRELAGLAHDAALRIDELGVGEHDELDRAGGRLAGRQVPRHPRTGVVLDGDAMADEIVQLRVVRHSAARYITVSCPTDRPWW